VKQAFATKVVLAVTGAALLVPLVVTNVSATTIRNVLTYGYNNARTGHDTVDPAITHLSSTPRWHSYLGAAVYGEPLVFGGNVIVATENNTVAAIAPSTGAVRWRVHLASPVTTTVIRQAPGIGSYSGNISPLGITGTPVISSSGIAYVSYEGYSGTAIWQHIRHYLAAIQLSNHVVLWRRIIDPPGGNALNGYTIAAEQQRPALLLLNSRVYVNFGGLAGDCGTYHGFVVSVATTGTGTESVYKVPSATEGAIWSVGGASVAANGHLLVATGNGASTTTFDGGDAAVELKQSLAVAGVFAPLDWATLTANDWDLGSGGVLPIPGTSLAFVAGKATTAPTQGFLLKVGAFGSGPATAPFTGQTCPNGDGGVWGAESTDTVTVGTSSVIYIYVPCRDGTEALKVTLGTSPSFSMVWTAPSGDPMGPPIVAGKLVWAINYYGNALVAMSPTTGHVSFTRSIDPVNHFATPLVVSGYVFVPTRTGVEAFTAT
jgi:outer membrane protein assembly factor BamB